MSQLPHPIDEITQQKLRRLEELEIENAALTVVLKESRTTIRAVGAWLLARGRSFHSAEMQAQGNLLEEAASRIITTVKLRHSA